MVGVCISRRYRWNNRDGTRVQWLLLRSMKGAAKFLNLICGSLEQIEVRMIFTPSAITALFKCFTKPLYKIGRSFLADRHCPCSCVRVRDIDTSLLGLSNHICGARATRERDYHIRLPL